MRRRVTLIFGSATMVVSYLIMVALADAYPSGGSDPNRVAAGFQVAFIYVIQMVSPSTREVRSWFQLLT